MKRAWVPWMLVAAMVGWIASDVAQADESGLVTCRAFYQDFPNGFVSPRKAVQKAEELGAKVEPWLEQEFAAGAKGLVLHSFIPYGTWGGAELVCIRR